MLYFLQKAFQCKVKKVKFCLFVPSHFFKTSPIWFLLLLYYSSVNTENNGRVYNVEIIKYFINACKTAKTMTTLLVFHYNSVLKVLGVLLQRPPQQLLEWKFCV